MSNMFLQIIVQYDTSTVRRTSSPKNCKKQFGLTWLLTLPPQLWNTWLHLVFYIKIKEFKSYEKQAVLLTIAPDAIYSKPIVHLFKRELGIYDSMPCIPDNSFVSQGKVTMDTHSNSIWIGQSILLSLPQSGLFYSVLFSKFPFLCGDLTGLVPHTGYCEESCQRRGRYETVHKILPDNAK